MTRRAHGEGTIRLRADGRWEARFPVRRADGTTITKSVYAKTRRAVMATMKAAQAAPALSDNPTLDDLLDDWLAEVKAHRAHNTWRAYRAQVDQNIRPTLGKTKLQALTPRLLQAWLRGLTTSTLRPASVAHARTVLGIALKYAERLEYLARNPLAHVTAPPVPATTHDAPTLDEVRAILAAIDHERLGTAYTMALLLGLRRGELLGLCWDDIDLSTTTATIRRQLQRENHQWVLKPTKGKRQRVLSLPPTLIARLAREPQREQQDRELAGPRWQETYDSWGLIFRGTLGQPLTGDTVLNTFRRALGRAGLPSQRLHDLRHHCASLLFAQGVPARLVMEILGHANTAITMNTYTHVLPTMTREALNELEERLRDGN